MMRKMRVGFLLLGAAFLFYASGLWAETIELVTYYPAAATAGNARVNSLVAAPAGEWAGVTPPDGTAVVFDRLGVGTNAPAGPLHVVGADDAASNVLFMPGADDPAVAGVPAIRVGIGTAAPQDPLHVAGTIRSAGTGFGGGIFLQNTTAATGRTYSVYSQDTGMMVFGDETATVPRMVIAANGNVGVGTAAPAGRLHVAGVDDAVSSVVFVAGADTVAAGVPGIRVGIGTATPQAALDVQDGFFLLGGNGDASGDGFIAPLDVLTIVSYMNGTRQLTTAEYARADLNGDGHVNYYDYAVLVDRLNAGNNTPLDAAARLTVRRTADRTLFPTTARSLGIAGVDPTLGAPNGETAGNLQANDVYLRSAGRWVSQMGGGGGRWTPAYADLGAVPYNKDQTLSYTLPAAVPTTAREILVYVAYHHGDGGNGQWVAQYNVYTQEGAARYVQSMAISTGHSKTGWYDAQSANMWLPHTSERKVYVTLLSPGDIYGNRIGWIRILGYR